MWWLATLALAQDVCPSGCTHTSIQAAIDAVPAGGSRIVVVEPGTYDETLVIDAGKNITLTAPVTQLAPVVLTHTVPNGVPLVQVTSASVSFGGLALDANLRQAVSAVDSDVSFTLGSVFGRGLGTRGGLFAIDGGSFTSNLATFTDGTVGLQGGLIWAHNADLTLQNTSMARGGAAEGGCLHATADDGLVHEVTITGGVYRDCSATLEGGAIRLEGDLLVDLDGVVVESSSASDGGGIALGPGVVASLDVVQFGDNSAFVGGGALFVRGATADLTGVSLQDNTAERGGAIAARGQGVVTLDTVLATSNEALGSGGAVHIEDATLRAVDVAYLHNQAVIGDGGGLFLSVGATWAEEVRTTYCNNTASQGGGVFSNIEQPATIRNVRFLDNIAVEEGGGIAHRGGAELTLSFANLLGNSAGLGSGAAVLTTGPLHLGHTLVGWSIGSVAVLDRAQGEVTLGRTAWYDNERGDIEGLSPISEDAIFDDPLLDRYAPSEACEVVQDWPSHASPLRDAGYGIVTDLDGTRADIGAYGGPDANPTVWLSDFDNDGSPLIYDCNDGDAAVYPLADDPPYDGLDSDCDRGDDFDFDRDGYRGLDYGGADCDDTDPNSYPGAPEDPAVDVDQNCDGVLDADLDGFERDVDCDDGDPFTYPGAPDDDNRVDRNCDGVVDGPRVFQTASCSTNPTRGLFATWAMAWLLRRRRRPAVAC